MIWRRLLGLVALLASAVACQGHSSDRNPIYPVEGTTWHVTAPEVPSKGDVRVDIFTSRVDCLNSNEVDEAEVEDCIPKIDRGNGQVSLAFRLIDVKSGGGMYLPLSPDQVEVAHMKSARPSSEWELIPHGAQQAGQLFIILIDGSSSIYATGGIEKIRKALLTPSVMDSFLSKRGGETTAVMLLRFSEDVKTIDGRDPLVEGAIIEDKARYQKMIQESLVSNDTGFSHVYQAVTFAATSVVGSKEIRNWMQLNKATPTIVLLTDGFNNEADADTCGTNVKRLEGAVQTLFKSKQEAGAYRPRIFTVGLGTAINPGFKLPPGGTITDLALCSRPGESFSDKKINGFLENVGIDNASLAWLADVGDGKTFVRNNHKGLASVFLEAAAQRYKWYTVKYHIDPFYQRRKFDTRISLKSGANAAPSSLTFIPNAWMDAPTGTIPKDARWFEPSPFRRSLIPLLSGLSFALLLTFGLPALFNTRRALFRRPKRK